MSFPRPARWLLLLWLAFTPSLLTAHSVGEEMAEAAADWLASLTPAQQTNATFALTDAERHNWHFIPRDRKGLPFREMTGAQKHLAHALLNSALSHRGYAKASTIMSLEQILRDTATTNIPVREPENYYFSIFGPPATNAVWGWRVEGHHLSLNFLVAPGDTIAVTPSFMGTNPGEVRAGPRQGLRVLAAEEDLARQLVKSLNATQRAAAIYTNIAPREIITGSNRVVAALSPHGIAAPKLDAAQNELLWQLIREYVERYRPEIADLDLAAIKQAGVEKLYFAWAGGLERGQPHYYRVQGPTFLLEYDNTQNGGNHAHAVWRKYAGDFGEDLLREHYLQTPHGK